ncbi:polysaccharide biosynthesis/export family protein [Methylosinus sp. PW1]|uniref:polysaccharide biosynthesis/export family protein n=1 Tax=Methylosinus sp. PW1 TaxID=107636 RepID=UPI0018DE57C0|nr:polysaccharide biosynthesis/export family protein [Methylosinus sp. PW1]
MSTSFGSTATRARPARLTFSRGDTVQATIFESQSGGLFVGDAGTRPGNFVQVPQQVVDAAGSIKIPYAGDIRVLGRTAESVQAEIEDKLASKAIQPQVFVSVVTQRGSEMSVLGEVNSASKIPLNPNGERVLDVISRAGGIKYPGYESYVTLQREGHAVRVPFDRLVRAPPENVFVQPGDVVYVSRDPRSYTVLGATGTQSRVPFPAERLVLSEAIGAGGGLVDTRANPEFVYLYRAEPRGFLERLGVDLTYFDASATFIPTIYRAKLHEPAALFAARDFEIRDKDVIYVADSDTVEVVKFFQLVSAITGPASQGASSAYSIYRVK